MYKDKNIEKIRCPSSDEFSGAAITAPPCDRNGRNCFVSLLNTTVKPSAERLTLKEYFVMYLGV
jgi:hypothetical protein